MASYDTALQHIKENAVTKDPTLDLSGLNLEKLPSEIGQLSHLTSLRLAHNSLVELPREIGQLTKLQELRLPYNPLQSFPKEIYRLTDLKKLSIFGIHSLSLLRQALQIVTLEELDLGYNNLFQLPKEISKLSNLRWLSIWNNHDLSRLPREIGRLKNLEVLRGGCRAMFELPKEIGQLVNLRELDWQYGNLIALPKEIGKLRKLTTLMLGSNKITQLPREIGRLGELRVLDIGHNGLTKLPKEFAALQNLETLDLEGNDFGGIPEEVRPLLKLKSLDCGQKALKKLPEWLWQFTNLQSLMILSSPLEELPRQIALLRNLQTLEVADCGLSALPKEIGLLSELETLKVGNNRLERIPEEIAQLSKLKVLNLSDNKLSELPIGILNLNNLESLHLKDNPLSIPPDIIEQAASPQMILNYLREFVFRTADDAVDDVADDVAYDVGYVEADDEAGAELTTLKIAVVSTADARDERLAVEDVVKELNGSVAAERKLRLEIVGWDNPLNESLADFPPTEAVTPPSVSFDADIAILILAHSFSETEMEGGIEEEIRTLLDNARRTGRPRLLCHASPQDSPSSASEESTGRGRHRMRQLKATLIREHNLSWYSTVQEFQTAIRHSLTGILSDWQVSPPHSQPPPPPRPRRVVGGDISKQLSYSSQMAFRTAEGLRLRLRTDEITTEILLGALFQKLDGPTQRLLTLYASPENARAQLQEYLEAQYEISLSLSDAPAPVEDVPTSALPISKNLEEVLLTAARLSAGADTDTSAKATIRTRHLLAALITTPGTVAGDWVAKLLGVERDALAEIVRHTPDFSLITNQVDSLRAGSGVAVLRGGNESAVTALTFTPDGTRLAVAHANASVVTWDVGQGVETGRISLRETALVLAYNPDGSGLATGGASYAIRMWFQSGADYSTAGHHRNPLVRAMAFSPDGRLFAVMSDDSVEMFETAMLRSRYFVDVSEPAAIFFSADSRQLFVLTRDGHIIRQDAFTEPASQSATRTHETWHAAVPLLDGKHFLAVRRDGVVSLWDAEATGSVLTYNQALLLPLARLAGSADGRYAAGVVRDGSLKVWSLEDGSEVFHLPPNGETPVEAIAMSADARTVAYARGSEVFLLRIPLAGSASADSRNDVAHRPGAQDEGATPSRWVLVAGTGTYELPSVERWFGRAVGHEIARAGWGLIVGGWQGIDHVAAAAFAEEIERAGLELSDRLIQVIPGTMGRPDFGGGQVIRVPAGDAEYIELVKRADAVVLIGGSGGTYRTFEVAEQFDKHVLPLAGTGGAAGGAYKAMLSSNNPLRQQWVNSKLFRELNRVPETEADAVEIRGALVGLLQSIFNPQFERGQAGGEAWFPLLSETLLKSFAWGEHLRRELDDGRLSTKHLLWALAGMPGLLQDVINELTPSKEALTSLHRHAGLEQLTTAWRALGEGIDPATAPLSRHALLALESAAALETRTGRIEQQHLLAGILSVPRCRSAKWLGTWLRLPIEQMRRVFAEGASDAEIVQELRRALAGAQSESNVNIRTFHLDFAEATKEATVGENVRLNLRLSANALPSGTPLTVVANWLELTVFVEAPGFQQESPSRFTLPVVDGVPVVTNDNAISLIPLVSGKQAVTLTVYGGKMSGVAPAVLKRVIPVLPSEVLPSIPELSDARLIPGTQPDVVLYVSHEEGTNDERLRMYLTCPALGIERRASESLSLTARELANLRHVAAQVAGRATHAPPRDALAGLTAFGTFLFNKLFPPGHEFTRLFFSILRFAEESQRTWSWLIISDERAVLPWEMVCPRRIQRGQQQPPAAQFLGGKFPLSHWVGRQRFQLTNEAPLGSFDILHYRQRPEHELEFWQAAIGGENYARVEDELDPSALLESGSPYYGLHVVRYEDARRSYLIAEAGDDADDESESLNAHGLVHDRQLDFTLRKPVVGLSLVRAQGAGSWGGYEFEQEWALPFMRAGASAVVGARWAVLDEADQLFFRAFYQELYNFSPIGLAVWRARAEVRRAFPHRADWLAYAHFGHPWCKPYFVEPSEGFILFEALGHPDDAPFDAGREYRFRASYRAEAPAWYDGRLQLMRPAEPEEEKIRVLVSSMLDSDVLKCELERVPVSGDYQQIISLRMPVDETNLPLVVRFKQGRRELHTLMLNLPIKEVAL